MMPFSMAFDISLAVAEPPMPEPYCRTFPPTTLGHPTGLIHPVILIKRF